MNIGIECIFDSIHIETVEELAEFIFPANNTTASYVITIDTDEDFIATIDQTSLPSGVMHCEICQATIAMVHSK